MIYDLQITHSSLLGSDFYIPYSPECRNEDCIRTQHTIHENKRVLGETASTPFLRSSNSPPVPAANRSTAPAHSPFHYTLSAVAPAGNDPKPDQRLSPSSSPNQTHSSPSPTHAPSPPSTPNSKDHKSLIIGVSLGGFALFFFFILVVYFYRRNRGTMVKPWASGLSGQLQKAFVAGKMIFL